ncbi:hypothetical protein [Colwellia psychrerythraea]|uniref:Uncharacterized protein n=1 Tax=Colwellia psychrerythraea TaxID=28229 RepID=A0A099L1P0_COLPS|nr:hypothetical protein [Colwellia psychrerythraea]KGJ96884.1 hypothetical protein GAB14E_1352 [Colwellia psychrerythraea]
MWRKLAVMLFLLVLAQAANALPISENNDNSAKNVSIAQIEQQTAATLDNDEPEDVFNVPRLTRLTPSIFTAEIQTSPNYVLVVEFFKIKLTAGLFKNLANPPVITHWFEQLSHKTKSSRLSGWKDGNFLYASRATYHS